jgi:putative membrane protein
MLPERPVHPVFFICALCYLGRIMTTDGKHASASDYLAAERTFLAWIRTGLALMGFGFALGRFGLFLRELAASNRVRSTEAPGVSLWVGTSLMLLGAVVNVISMFHHISLTGRLSRGEQISGPSKAAIAVALVLAALAFGLAIYYMVLIYNGSQ